MLADREIVRSDARPFRRAIIVGGELAPGLVDCDDPPRPVQDRNVGTQGVENLLGIGWDARSLLGEETIRPSDPRKLADRIDRLGRRERQRLAPSVGGYPCGARKRGPRAARPWRRLSGATVSPAALGDSPGVHSMRDSGAKEVARRDRRAVVPAGMSEPDRAWAELAIRIAFRASRRNEGISSKHRGSASS